MKSVRKEDGAAAARKTDQERCEEQRGGKRLYFRKSKKRYVSDADGGERTRGELCGHNRYGGNAEEHGREMLVKLLHGEENGAQWRSGCNGEAG